MQTVRDYEFTDKMTSYPEEYIAAICDADRHTIAVAEAAKWERRAKSEKVT